MESNVRVFQKQSKASADDSKETMDRPSPSSYSVLAGQSHGGLEAADEEDELDQYRSPLDFIRRFQGSGTEKEQRGGEGEAQLPHVKDGEGRHLLSVADGTATASAASFCDTANWRERALHYDRRPCGSGRSLTASVSHISGCHTVAPNACPPPVRSPFSSALQTNHAAATIVDATAREQQCEHFAPRGGSLVSGTVRMRLAASSASESPPEMPSLLGDECDADSSRMDAPCGRKPMMIDELDGELLVIIKAYYERKRQRQGGDSFNCNVSAPSTGASRSTGSSPPQGRTLSQPLRMPGDGISEGSSTDVSHSAAFHTQGDTLYNILLAPPRGMHASGAAVSHRMSDSLGLTDGAQDEESQRGEHATAAPGRRHPLLDGSITAQRPSTYAAASDVWEALHTTGNLRGERDGQPVVEWRDRDGHRLLHGVRESARTPHHPAEASGWSVLDVAPDTGGTTASTMAAGEPASLHSRVIPSDPGSATIHDTSLPTFSATSFVRAYVLESALSLEPALLVSGLAAALNMVVVYFLQHHVLDTRDHLGLFLIGSYLIFSSYYMIYYFLERFSSSFRRIASLDKKFYIIGNLIKAGILISITPFAFYHLVRMLIFDVWESNILRNLGCIYTIPDFISMIVVRRMRWSTWVHHLCVVVFNYFSILNDYRNENVCRCVVVYAGFSTFAYCVNVLLASRFLRVPAAAVRVLSFVALVVYVVCCAVNWAWQVYYLRRLIYTGNDHWTVYAYMGLISLVMWDDVVLNKWLLHNARNTAYVASQQLHRCRQQQLQPPSEPTSRPCDRVGHDGLRYRAAS